MLTPLQENSYSLRIHKSLHESVRELKQTLFTLILHLKPKNDKTSAY